MPSKKVDKVSILRATSIAKEKIKRTLETARDLETDPKKKERKEKQICACCFYIHYTRIGGNAITKQPCGICKETQTYSSTATNTLCQPCGKANDLCVVCGGDIEIKERRKARNYEG